jgi:DNA-binding SARP family transcriptional activator
MTALRIQTLGPLQVERDGQALALGGRAQRALLARLLLEPGRTVPVSRLVDDLWGENAPASASKMIQIYVSMLRKVLPEGVLVTRSRGYAVELPREAIDLSRFEDLRQSGQAALAAGSPAYALEKLREALALWRGAPLGELDEPFATIESRRLEEVHLATLEDRIEAELELGRHGALVAELHALVAHHPLRERLRGQLMLALYGSGRQADALAEYHRVREVLLEDLGIEPSPSLRELERRILQQDPMLLVTASRPRPPIHAVGPERAVRQGTVRWSTPCPAPHLTTPRLRIAA